MTADEAKKFNPHPLYSYSASYYVPSGQLSHMRGVVRCAESDIGFYVLEHIRNNPRRQYLKGLHVYSVALIPEGKAA